MNAPTKNIPALDGLRALCLLLVYISHRAYFFPKDFYFSTLEIQNWGRVGVLLFFYLSGFLMAYHYIPNDRVATPLRYWGAFAIRRLLRIYPTYIAVLFALWGTSHFLASSYYTKYTFDAVVSHILLTLNYDVFWAIPIELKFYMLFPLLATAVLFLPSTTRPYWLFYLWILSIAYSYLYSWKTLSMNLTHIVPSYFLGGIFVASLMNTPIKLESAAYRRVLDIIFIACMAIMLCWGHMAVLDTMDSYRSYTILYSPLIVLILFSATHGSIVTQFLSHKIMRFIGRISFSIYLIHYSIHKITLFPIPTALALPLDVIMVFTLSYLVYCTIELPCNQLGRQLAGKINPGYP